MIILGRTPERLTGRCGKTNRMRQRSAIFSPSMHGCCFSAGAFDEFFINRDAAVSLQAVHIEGQTASAFARSLSI